MKKMLFPLIVLLAIGLSACNMTTLSGSGNIVSTSRTVSGFTRLVLDAPGELTITQNGKEALTVEGDDNLLEHVKSKVTNGELHIYVESDTLLFEPSKPIQYSLSVKKLERVLSNASGNIHLADFESDQFALRLNGSGSIFFDSLKVKTLDVNSDGSGLLNLEKLTAQNVTLKQVGSGDVMINTISANELQVSVSGSGDCTLKGKVTHQNVSMVGSGHYNARSLESAQAEVSIAGSGGSQVWVTEAISVSILGSGSVGYAGNPSKITQTINGSGSVYPLK